MRQLINRGGYYSHPALKIETGTSIDRYLKGYNPHWFLLYDKTTHNWHIAYISERNYIPFLRFKTHDRPGDMYIIEQVQKSWRDSHEVKRYGVEYFIREQEYEDRRREEREREDWEKEFEDALKPKRIIVS